MNEIILGDCLEKMKKIKQGSIDMILTDLPYGTTANKWDVIIPFDELWDEWYRLKKNDAMVVLTSTQPFTTKLINSNMNEFKYNWVWKKSAPTGYLLAHKQPMRIHEDILVFCGRKYNPQGLIKYDKIVKRGSHGSNYQEKTGLKNYQEFTNYPRSILEIKNQQKKQHPTQKPVTLFEYLIKTYTNEGDTVLDCCAGSGTTGVACKNLNRNYILIEKEEKYYNIIKERLK